MLSKETVVIQLLDEEGNPVFTLKLANAFPIKITGTDLKSDGNEVAIETLELCMRGWRWNDISCFDNFLDDLSFSFHIFVFPLFKEFK
ncbi:MAG: phage tail protein [Bacteroidales bacterium]